MARYSDLFTVGHPSFEAMAAGSLFPFCIITSDSGTIGAAASDVSWDVSITAPPPKIRDIGITNEMIFDILILSFEFTSIQRAITPKQNAITIMYSTPLTNV